MKTKVDHDERWYEVKMVIWADERTSHTYICQYDFISALHNNPEFALRPRSSFPGALNSSKSTLIFLTGDMCISPQEIQFQLLGRNETSLRATAELSQGKVTDMSTVWGSFRKDEFSFYFHPVPDWCLPQSCHLGGVQNWLK